MAKRDNSITDELEHYLKRTCREDKDSSLRSYSSLDGEEMELNDLIEGHGAGIEVDTDLVSDTDSTQPDNDNEW